MRTKTAIVTGASSGIGAATAKALSAAGYHVILGARRVDRVERLAGEIGGEGYGLDVTDPASVRSFMDRLPDRIDLLVNNAGGALGLDPVISADEDRWIEMFQSNVMGTLRMTKGVFPRLERSGDGSHIVNIGSIAAWETYLGGAGYTAAKHAVRALTETLRLEWLGLPIRVTEIDPGLVDTEFSVVRFSGDEIRARKVYEGMTPLSAGDVAEAVVWAALRPPHVNIDQILIRPRDQARADKVSRVP
ncbi:MAG: SDR family NAD(P)-dependent oxidoreductase [Leptospirillum sp.]|nr:SDR family NAD(P)-dependent oxidoreductase [Nitrospiraceae bacterium]